VEEITREIPQCGRGGRSSISTRPRPSSASGAHVKGGANILVGKITPRKGEDGAFPPEEKFAHGDLRGEKGRKTSKDSSLESGRRGMEGCGSIRLWKIFFRASRTQVVPEKKGYRGPEAHRRGAPGLETDEEGPASRKPCSPKLRPRLARGGRRSALMLKAPANVWREYLPAGARKPVAARQGWPRSTSRTSNPERPLRGGPTRRR